MSYTGQIGEIKFGQYGLVYDMAQQDIPNNALIRCENVQFYNGLLEKADEFVDWVIGNAAHSTPVFTGEKPISVTRYYPMPRIQRHIVVTDEGRIYKYSSKLFREEVLPLNSTAPTTLSISQLPMVVQGGNEVQGNPKKAFIFSGNSQVQVIDGDGVTHRNIRVPAADWSTSFPTFGFIYRSSLLAFGNESDPHRIYISPSNDQENFDATNPNFVSISCFPGEGDGLTSGIIYKGRVFFFKKPYGVYALIDTDPDPSKWYTQRVSSSFGIASPMAFFEGINDVFIMSSDGAIVSMSAAFTLGDIYSADVLSQAQSSSVFRNIIRKQFLQNAFAKFLPQKKIGYFFFPSFKSVDGKCDSAIHIDFNLTIPRISWHRYNGNAFTCADYYKDAYGDDNILVGKLYYSGSTYNHGTLSTTYKTRTSATPFRIRTPNSNLGVAANKDFDHIELIFEGTNAYPLAVDVFIDSKFSQTILIQPYFKKILGPPLMNVPKYSEPPFVLDQSAMNSRGLRPKMNSIKGRGQFISFMVRDGNVLSPPYTGGPNPDDDSGSANKVKIAGIRVYYRLAGQDQKAQTS